MSGSVSTNYRELAQDEIAAVAASCAEAWKDPAIPLRQYLLAAQPELERYRRGEQVPPFDALVRCLKRLPEEMKWPETKFLDVGASAGYYLEVLRQNSFYCDYTACDFSPAFKVLAEELYPGIKFDVADARQLPYEPGSFDVVLSGATLMHCAEHDQVIAELARVSKQFVILHRTPVLTQRPTTAYLKDGYDVPMIEFHFNESDLFNWFAKYGLTCVWQDEVFFDFEKSFGHREYVLIKQPDIEPYASVKSV